MAETVKDNAKIQVQNLADHTVGFIDEDTHRRVIFQPYEIKNLDAGMLRRLNFSYGGNVLLNNYLSVKNATLAAEFGVSSDTIEYNWTKDDVDRVLTSGSLEELQDALDFGPDGIKDLIVDRAIELKLNSMEKRQAILDILGKDVSAMIRLKEEVEASDKTESEPAKTRRTKTEKTTSGRRVAATSTTEE